MYEQVSTGPLYDKAVQLLSTYRSVAARMGNARSSTQGKLDRRLEKLSQRISETLSELTDNELMALDCWRDGVLPGLYEVDHTAIVEKPYVSIRKILRWTEEHDVADMVQPSDNNTDTTAAERSLLKKFLSVRDDDEL
ncbi:hypothetical protein N9792_03730 [Planktomarina temperata]|nr:hypothetical protein [Planktomarina temperata]MDB4200225.1 hypothetical protein [Planktomarina temperata]MDC1193294.1 hypothetical protein [Planktomarina temperata]